jgi:hypothetical protein
MALRSSKKYTDGHNLYSKRSRVNFLLLSFLVVVKILLVDVSFGLSLVSRKENINFDDISLVHNIIKVRIDI